MKFINKYFLSLEIDRRNIIILLLIGLLVRLWGVHYGLPAVYNSTEYFIAKHALSLGARKTLEPLFFIYPTFYVYLIALLYGLLFLLGKIAGIYATSSAFAFQFLTDPSSFYLLGRLFNTFAILLASIVLYRTVRFYLKPGLSFLISMLLIFSMNIHHYTFWMVPDAPVVLGVMVLVYFIVKNDLGILTQQNLFWASLICGLTISAKYNAGFIAPAWLLSVLIHTKKEWLQRVISGSLACTGILLGFLIGSPYWVLEFREFLHGFQMVASQAVFAYNIETGLPYLWEMSQFIRSEWLLGVVFILLIISFPFNMNRLTLILATIVLPTFLYVGSWQKKGLDYLLVIFPPLLTYLAYLFSKKPAKQIFGSLILYGVILMLMLNVPRIMYQNFLRSQTDTRQLLEIWLKDNLPTGSRICYDHYHYDIHIIDLDRYLTYGEGSRYLNEEIKTKIERIKNLPNYFRFISAQKILTVPHIPDSLYSIVQHDSFLWQAYTHPHKSLDEIIADSTDLLILNSETYRKYLNNQLPPIQNPLREDFLDRRNFYQTIFTDMKPIKIISPGWKNAGPTLQIFDLRGVHDESHDWNQRLQL